MGGVERTGSAESAARPVARVYCVPRRYDLATLFAVTSAYALLCGAMQMAGAHPAATLTVAGFVTLVGIGQALLFRGRAPRAASAVVGYGVVAIPMILLPAVLQRGLGLSLLDVIFFAVFVGGLYGALLGYVAGVFVAGVFLVADYARAAVRWMRQPGSFGAEQQRSPPDIFGASRGQR